MPVDAMSILAHPMGIPTKQKLSDQIRSAVRDCGRTQKLVCEKTNIDRAALSRFVRGERGLSLDGIDRLATFLGLRLANPERRRKT